MDNSRLINSILVSLLFGINFCWSQSLKISSLGYNEIDNSFLIQKAIDTSFDTIIFDSKTKILRTGPLKFNGIRNKVFVFQDGLILRASADKYLNKTDALMSFVNSSNIIIRGNNATLEMNKEEYIDGEWRHGISLRNCSNVTIESIDICNTGGDGIYIAGNKSGEYSKNININNIKSYNNKRQGMSIISAVNVKVKNSSFLNTIGTLPGAGLDIEPNKEVDRIVNIEFDNCKFMNNDHAGIVLALQNLKGSSLPVKIKFTNCMIVNNHNESNKYIASELVFNAHKNDPVRGNVVFENCLVQNSKWGFLYSRKTSESYMVHFKDCRAIDICKNGTFPAIYLEVPDYYKGRFNLGGYKFDNLYLEFSSKVPYFMVRGSSFPTLNRVENITGSIIIKSNSKIEAAYLKYDSSKNTRVNFNIKRIDG